MFEDILDRGTESTAVIEMRPEGGFNFDDILDTASVSQAIEPSIGFDVEPKSTWFAEAPQLTLGGKKERAALVKPIGEEALAERARFQAEPSTEEQTRLQLQSDIDNDIRVDPALFALYKTRLTLPTDRPVRFKVSESVIAEPAPELPEPTPALEPPVIDPLVAARVAERQATPQPELETNPMNLLPEDWRGDITKYTGGIVSALLPFGLGEQFKPPEGAAGIAGQVAGGLASFILPGGIVAKTLGKSAGLANVLTTIATKAPKYGKFLSVATKQLLTQGATFGLHGQIQAPITTDIKKRVKILGHDELQAALFAGAGTLGALAGKTGYALSYPAMFAIGYNTAGIGASKADKLISGFVLTALHGLGAGKSKAQAEAEAIKIIQDRYGVDEAKAREIAEGITTSTEYEKIVGKAEARLIKPPAKVGMETLTQEQMAEQQRIAEQTEAEALLKAAETSPTEVQPMVRIPGEVELPPKPGQVVKATAVTEEAIKPPVEEPVKPPKVEKKPPELMAPTEFEKAGLYDQAAYISDAIEKKLPISVVAEREIARTWPTPYNADIEMAKIGYVREGDRYVFRIKEKVKPPVKEPAKPTTEEIKRAEEIREEIIAPSPEELARREAERLRLRDTTEDRVEAVPPKPKVEVQPPIEPRAEPGRAYDEAARLRDVVETGAPYARPDGKPHALEVIEGESPALPLSTAPRGSPHPFVDQQGRLVDAEHRVYRETVPIEPTPLAKKSIETELPASRLSVFEAQSKINEIDKQFKKEKSAARKQALLLRRDDAIEVLKNKIASYISRTIPEATPEERLLVAKRIQGMLDTTGLDVALTETTINNIYKDVRFSIQPAPPTEKPPEQEVALPAKIEVPTTPAAKPEPGTEQGYWIALKTKEGGRTFKPVKGKPVIVPGLEDLDLFVRRDSQNKNFWVISEGSTGLALSQPSRTQAGAIADIQEMMRRRNISAEAVRSQIAEISEKTPRYQTEKPAPPAKPVVVLSDTELITKPMTELKSAADARGIDTAGKTRKQVITEIKAAQAAARTAGPLAAKPLETVEAKVEVPVKEELAPSLREDTLTKKPEVKPKKGGFVTVLPVSERLADIGRSAVRAITRLFTRRQGEDIDWLDVSETTRKHRNMYEIHQKGVGSRAQTIVGELSKTFQPNVIQADVNSLFANDMTLADFRQKYRLPESSPLVKEINWLKRDRARLSESIAENLEKQGKKELAKIVRGNQESYMTRFYMRHIMGNDYVPEKADYDAAVDSIRTGLSEQINKLSKRTSRLGRVFEKTGVGASEVERYLERGEESLITGLKENQQDFARLLRDRYMGLKRLTDGLKFNPKNINKGNLYEIETRAEALDSAAKDTIDYILNPEGIEGSRGGFPIDINHLTKRTLTPVLRQLFQEVGTPVEKLQRTAEVQGNMLVGLETLNKIYEDGVGRWWTRGAPDKANGLTVRLQGKRFGKLDGAFVSRATSDLLHNQQKAVSAVMRAYEQVVGYQRAIQVATSLPTTERNLLSDYFSRAVGNGDVFIEPIFGRKASYHKNLGKSISFLFRLLKARKGTPEYTSLLAELEKDAELDIFHSKENSIIVDLREEAGSFGAKRNLLERMFHPLGVLKENVGKVYSHWNYITKKASYLTQKELGKSEAEAAEHVRLFYEHPSSLPIALRAVAKLPLADYPTYYFGSIRNKANQAKYAAEQAAKGNVGPLIGFGLSNALYALATQSGTQWANNLITKKVKEKLAPILSVEQLRAMKEFQPDYWQNKPMIARFDKDAKGNPVIDYVVAGGLFAFPLDDTIVGALQNRKLSDFFEDIGKDLLKSGMTWQTISKALAGREVGLGASYYRTKGVFDFAASADPNKGWKIASAIGKAALELALPVPRRVQRSFQRWGKLNEKIEAGQITKEDSDEQKKSMILSEVLPFKTRTITRDVAHDMIFNTLKPEMDTIRDLTFVVKKGTDKQATSTERDNAIEARKSIETLYRSVIEKVKRSELAFRGVMSAEDRKRTIMEASTPTAGELLMRGDIAKLMKLVDLPSSTRDIYEKGRTEPYGELEDITERSLSGESK